MYAHLCLEVFVPLPVYHPRTVSECSWCAPNVSRVSVKCLSMCEKSLTFVWFRAFLALSFSRTSLSRSVCHVLPVYHTRTVSGCPQCAPKVCQIHEKHLSIFQISNVFGIFISLVIQLHKCSSDPKCTNLEQFLDVPSVPQICPG